MLSASTRPSESVTTICSPASVAVSSTIVSRRAGTDWSGASLAAAVRSATRAERIAGAAEHRRLEIGVRPPLHVQSQRNHEREHHPRHEIGGGEDEAGAEAHSSSAAEAKRKPTLRTVWT